MNLSILKRKQMMALVTVAGLALLATAALASNPFVLDWRVLGFGPATGTCQVSFTSGCTSVSIGSAQGTHIGGGTYTLSVTSGSYTACATDANGQAGGDSEASVVAAGSVVNGVAVASDTTLIEATTVSSSTVLATASSVEAGSVLAAGTEVI